MSYTLQLQQPADTALEQGTEKSADGHKEPPVNSIHKWWCGYTGRLPLWLKEHPSIPDLITLKKNKKIAVRDQSITSECFNTFNFVT